MNEIKLFWEKIEYFPEFRSIIFCFTRSLNTLSVQSSMLAKESLNNADKAEYTIGEALSIVQDNNIDRIPDEVKKAKQLSKELVDAILNAGQVSSQLDMINQILPQMRSTLDKMASMQNSINGSGNSFDQSFEKLKMNVTKARDLANSIRIGLTFFPNTTLELKNPESLMLQSTETKISLYFRTDKENGLLLYLGNENRTNSPRIKTVCQYYSWKCIKKKNLTMHYNVPKFVYSQTLWLFQSKLVIQYWLLILVQDLKE